MATKAQVARMVGAAFDALDPGSWSCEDWTRAEFGHVVEFGQGIKFVSPHSFLITADGEEYTITVSKPRMKKQ